MQYILRENLYKHESYMELEHSYVSFGYQIYNIKKNQEIEV